MNEKESEDCLSPLPYNGEENWAIEDVGRVDIEPSLSPGFPCSALTGIAGTGKSYQTIERMKSDPGIVLSATTGISAVNLGNQCKTIHSLLGFFDHESLMEKYIAGRVQKKIWDLVDDGVREIAIDEVSMLPGPSLDLIYQAFEEVNLGLVQQGREQDVIGLKLIFDFCQLPAVNAPYAFEASNWDKFAANLTRLTKVWRQSNAKFLEALNRLREGKGGEGAEILRQIGVTFHSSIDAGFDGTTLMAKNDQVDRYNLTKLNGLPGKAFGLRSTRWAIPEILDPMRNKQPGDWEKIPELLTLKIGARVMILANDNEGWTYANGSTGVITGLDGGAGRATYVEIELDNGNQVSIGKITRRVTKKKLPEGYGYSSKDKSTTARDAIDAMATKKPYWDEKTGKWCLGEISYYPLRLAWASTLHKSQGLSLDRVQIDTAAHFCSAPAMMYVGFSRCRTPEGLRVVGTPELLAKRCKIDEKVRAWL